MSFIEQEQVSALEKAAQLQGHDYSLTPNGTRFQSQKSSDYHQISQLDFHFHQERHAFANHQYERITQCLSPVQSISIRDDGRISHLEYLSQTLGINLDDAKKVDKDARLTISNMLGHGREAVTSQYIGGKS
ncbi:hypothetical protein L0B53_02245 [Vibrio sp. SS-MA-C1-2]|uniref:hypothetical protein n=1 Tax=Vibrio sp. SS-MA-C1-2 TaxID=2908646 RepID=UPI001F392843|nr:hypothetical protein [Vibrio sp. SS-MA-C1-2]UJF17611.1 hypothetical protein L0B53_02245 [Vibrio sp. SS-MA-C1-2]